MSAVYQSNLPNPHHSQIPTSLPPHISDPHLYNIQQQSQQHQLPIGRPQAPYTSAPLDRGTSDSSSANSQTTAGLYTYSSGEAYYEGDWAAGPSQQYHSHPPTLVHSLSDPSSAFTSTPSGQGNQLDSISGLPSAIGPRPVLSTSYSAPDPSMIPHISSNPQSQQYQHYQGYPVNGIIPRHQYHPHQPPPIHQQQHQLQQHQYQHHHQQQHHQHQHHLQHQQHMHPAGMHMHPTVNGIRATSGQYVGQENGVGEEWGTEWDEEEQSALDWYHQNMEVSSKISSSQIQGRAQERQVDRDQDQGQDREQEQDEVSNYSLQADLVRGASNSGTFGKAADKADGGMNTRKTLGAEEDRRALLACHMSPPLPSPPSSEAFVPLSHTLPPIRQESRPPAPISDRIFSCGAIFDGRRQTGEPQESFKLPLFSSSAPTCQDRFDSAAPNRVLVPLSPDRASDLNLPPGMVSDHFGHPLYTIRPDGTKVKHRRRTTPEQLKVLEHWFSINPKPDNALREWLAGELGMTKRNVQVWFQNRRAKIKGLQLKEKAAQEKAAEDGDEQKTPERQMIGSRPSTSSGTTIPSIIQPPPSSHISFQQTLLGSSPDRAMPLPMHVPGPVLNGGRRVSLANGEAEKIQVWAAKRRAGALTTSPRSPALGLGQANAARRGSIPYPTPLSASFDPTRSASTGMGPPPPVGSASPKFSPSVRPTASMLHLTAIRNNTRRASMPNAPQLISSGPFTPPRLVSGAYPAPRANRELSPIKDADTEFAVPQQPALVQTFAPYPGESDFSTTYLTPPSSTYNAATGGIDPSTLHRTNSVPGLDPGSAASSGSFTYLPPSSEPYTPQGPLPNPGFSFGNNPIFSLHSAPGTSMDGNFAQQQTLSEEDQRTQAIYTAIQERGRLGSLASVGTWTTDETAGGFSGEDSEGENKWGGVAVPPGLEGWDGGRRASAPAELFGLLGIAPLPSSNGLPLRPSPLGLGSSFTAIDTQNLGGQQSSATGTNDNTTTPDFTSYSLGALTQPLPDTSGLYLQESPVEMSASNSIHSGGDFGTSLVPTTAGSTPEAQIHSLHQNQNQNQNSGQAGRSISLNIATSGHQHLGTVSAPASAYPTIQIHEHHQDFNLGHGLDAPSHMQMFLTNQDGSSPNPHGGGVGEKKHRSLSPLGHGANGEPVSPVRVGSAGSGP